MTAVADTATSSAGDGPARLEGARRVLVCSGQTAIDADGNPPTTKDMAAQIAVARLAFPELMVEIDATAAD